jgi:hypothetical protein
MQHERQLMRQNKQAQEQHENDPEGMEREQEKKTGVRGTHSHANSPAKLKPLAPSSQGKLGLVQPG